MSMLAERKIKQKWGEVTGGKLWSEDQNKFGQKMLEKMGWSKGKGLGTNLQGMSEHLKIKYKMDTKGVGHKDRDDQWTKHEDHFSKLLQSLSSQTDENIVNIERTTTSASLVDKSANTKARIHYKKFTRGKDLTKYSEKDLANVFGRKQLKKTTEADERETEEEEDGKNFRQGGCMADYFKKKMGAKNGALPKEAESETEERPSFGLGFKTDDSAASGLGFKSEEGMGVAGFGLGFKPEDTTESNGLGFKNNDESENTEPKRNGKFGFGFMKAGLGFNKSKDGNTDSKKVNGFINFTKSTTDLTDEVNKLNAKKKKKRKNDVHADLTGETSFVETADEETTETHADLNGDTFHESPKKKKKKTKDSDNSVQGSNVSMNESNADGELDVSISKKSKSAKKQQENTISSEANSDEPTAAKEDETPKKSKKKKDKRKSKHVDSPMVRSNCEIETSLEIKQAAASLRLNDGDELEVVTPKKKGKKKQQEETPSFVSYISENAEETDANPKKRKLEEAEDHTPKRKKKKCKETGLSNPAFDPFFHAPPVDKHQLNTINEDEVEIDSVDVGNEKNKDEDVTIEEEKETKKKSKKKKKEKEGGMENACFNGLDDSRVDEGAAENPYEVKTKKKKKSKSKDKDDSLNEVNVQSNGIDNPALNLTPAIEEDLECDLMLNTTTQSSRVQRRKSVTFSERNQEHIIPNREQLARQNELFEINTQILEESAKKKKKGNVPEGIDNEAFSALPQREREKLRYEERFRYAVDTYELQVENALNERKSLLVGDLESQLEEGVPHEEGVILPYKKATFMGVNYGYFTSDIDSAKSGYKHFIRGDILVAFKNSNLHQIKGYGIDVTKVET